MTQQLQPPDTIKPSLPKLSTSLRSSPAHLGNKPRLPCLPPHSSRSAGRNCSAHTARSFMLPCTCTCSSLVTGCSANPFVLLENSSVWKPNSTITPCRKVSLAQKTVNRCFLMPPLHPRPFRHLSMRLFYLGTSCRLGLSPAPRPSPWCMLIRVF